MKCLRIGRFGFVIYVDDYNPAHVHAKAAKVRITMMVDLDVVKGYRKLAEKTGSKYQTLMNQKLKAALLSENEKSDLTERVSKLEQIIYGKKQAV